MLKLHKHPRDMPAARWTTTVNKAIENFTINYFKRINTSQVFNCITEIFQNLRVNTPLNCLVLENTEICLPDKILAACVNPKTDFFQLLKDSEYQNLSQRNTCQEVTRQSTNDWCCSTETEPGKMLAVKLVKADFKMLKAPGIRYQLKCKCEVVLRASTWAPCRSPGRTSQSWKLQLSAFHHSLVSEIQVFCLAHSKYKLNSLKVHNKALILIKPCLI